MKRDSEQEVQFLMESNAIERVYDHESLRRAYAAWEWMMNQPELTHENILKCHDILMVNQLLEPKYKGHYRDCHVSIGGKLGLAPDLVKLKMDDWIADTKNPELAETEEEMHVIFEHIHPFADGNGRIGRILYNWQRLKNGKELVIIYNDNKQEYYEWFQPGYVFPKDAEIL